MASWWRPFPCVSIIQLGHLMERSFPTLPKKNLAHSRVPNEGSTNSYIKMINSKEFESVLKKQKDLSLIEIFENTLLPVRITSSIGLQPTNYVIWDACQSTWSLPIGIFHKAIKSGYFVIYTWIHFGMYFDILYYFVFLVYWHFHINVGRLD